MAAGSISGLMVRGGAPDSATRAAGSAPPHHEERPQTNPYCLRGMQNWIASSLALFAVTRLTSARIKRPRQLMPRIAVGGFLHETNTFAPTTATYDDFVHGGGWTSMARIAEITGGRLREGEAQIEVVVTESNRCSRRPPAVHAGPAPPATRAIPFQSRRFADGGRPRALRGGGFAVGAGETVAVVG